MKPKKPLQRTDLMDTRIEAHRRQIELLRKMPPEEKVRISLAMRESLRELRRIAQAHERPSDRRGL